MDLIHDLSLFLLFLHGDFSDRFVQVGIELLPDGVDLAMFCGPQDANLRTIEDLFDVAISLHPDCVVASGDALDIPVISSLIADLLEMVEARKVPTQDDVHRIAEVLRNSD